MKARDQAAELSERRERLLLIVCKQRQQLGQQLAPVFRGSSVVDARVAAVRNVMTKPVVIGAAGVALFLIGPRRALRFIKHGTRVWLLTRRWLPLVSALLTRRR